MTLKEYFAQVIIEDKKEKIYRECEMLAKGYRNIYENAVKENALYELSTSHEKGTAVVQLSGSVDDAALKNAVEEEGYEVTGIR